MESKTTLSCPAGYELACMRSGTEDSGCCCCCISVVSPITGEAGSSS